MWNRSSSRRKPTARRRRKSRSMRSPECIVPKHPSIFGGLLRSSVGWFILLVIYAANLYAAYEIAVVRGRPAGVVIGLSAVLPLIGPVFFLTKSDPAGASGRRTGSRGGAHSAGIVGRVAGRVIGRGDSHGLRHVAVVARRKRNRSRRCLRAANSRSTSALSKRNLPASSARPRAKRKIVRWRSRP